MIDEARKPKDPPFRIDIDSGTSLTDQMVRGFREAILSGYYKPGDALPPIRSLEQRFGVSLFVPREALARLAKEGLVNPRPRIGSVVTVHTGATARRGHVMLVIPDVPGAYYANAFGDVLRAHLAAAGYSFTRVSVPKKDSGAYDPSVLDFEYNRHIDLTVLLYDVPEIARYLSRRGVPFVAVGQRPCKLRHCVGNVYRPRNGVAGEFFRHCRLAGVKRVLLADWEGEGFSVLEGVPHPGVRVEMVRVPSKNAERCPGDIQRGALDYFRKLLAQRRERLPDLVFLADDNVAIGAALAFLEARIKVPEEMRLAAWTHLGGGVVHPLPLTRMEMDPYDQGRRVAKAILNHLSGGVFPVDIALRPVYIVGKSFP